MERSKSKIWILAIVTIALIVFGAGRISDAGQGESKLRELYSRPVSDWPAPKLDSTAHFTELGSLPEVAYPADNPYSKLKEELGRRLFFDPRLSVSNQIACASCHDSELGWGDGRRTSFGHNRQRGRRNAPSVLNAGHWDKLFWDGRAATLEEQAFFPIQDHVEMNQDLQDLEAELNAVPAYRKQFKAAFGQEEVTKELVAKALATFERGIVSRRSRFDQFVEGNYSRLTGQEIEGLHLFRTKAGCINCHNGPLFSDQQFHNDGFSGFGRPGEDLGLYELNGDTADMGKFRTPMLRDIAFTGPYMHNGTIAELEELIFMYDQGMPQAIPKKYRDGKTVLPRRSHIIKPLNLSEEERTALLAFLNAISTRPRPMRAPDLP